MIIIKEVLLAGFFWRCN